jgi:hypothetical protein
VPLGQTSVTGGFWGPRLEAAVDVTAPHCLDQIEAVGDVENFRRCAAGLTGGHQGRVYNDSDVFKTLEGVANALRHRREPDLEERADKLVAEIAAAQREDGYLNTAYQLGTRGEPFSNLTNDHEVYCAGHLMEAGDAYAQATGKDALLGVARRYADLLCDRFAAQEGYCGHPEAEFALFRLADATGEQKYARLAHRWVRERGGGFTDREKSPRPAGFDAAYYVDDVPLAQMEQVHGHAVRAAYFLAAGAESARRNHDPSLVTALERVWSNAAQKRTFVTGGIGPSHENEGFTADYDLPNETAYQETCASVGLAMWSHRMGLLTGKAAYWDAVEAALYNAFLAGVSLRGDAFFYVNPLASKGGHLRQPWFDCACCPPNVLRTLAGVAGYAYAASGDALSIGLFVQGEVCAALDKGGIQAKVETEYPWDGTVRVSATSDAPATVRVRVPEWCGKADASMKGARTELRDGWLHVEPGRAWSDGDVLEVRLETPVRLLAAHPAVASARGRCAVRRGPLVYCAEQAGNSDGLDGVWLPPGARIAELRAGAWLGDGVELAAEAARAPVPDWEGGLYREQAPGPACPLRLTPYFAWANRTDGPMAVWLPQSPGAPILS